MNITKYIFTFLLIFIVSCNTFSNGGKEYVINNYKKEVDIYAKKYNLPSSYFLALIMLESSGRKVIKPRYEYHVYKSLKALRDGRIEKFEDLTFDDVKYFSNRDLKRLSKSYGPFQIMGYKAIKMGIDLDDFQGDSAIKYGIEWIEKEYGNVLRKGNYMDAFHIHNTGRAFPKDGKSLTYDPDYVKNGIKFMHYFSKLY